MRYFGRELPYSFTPMLCEVTLSGFADGGNTYLFQPLPSRLNKNVMVTASVHLGDIDQVRIDQIKKSCGMIMEKFSKK